MKNILLIATLIVFSIAFSLLAQDPGDLTLEQKASWMGTQMDRLIQISNDVSDRFDRIQGGQDVVLIRCLGDKLGQILSLMRFFEERIELFEAAIENNDLALANHHFTALRVSFRRVDSLKNEADNCVDDIDVDFGVNEREAVIDDDIADEEDDEEHLNLVVRMDEEQNLTVETVIIFRNIDGDEKRLIVTTSQ